METLPNRFDLWVCFKQVPNVLRAETDTRRSLSGAHELCPNFLD